MMLAVTMNTRIAQQLVPLLSSSSSWLTKQHQLQLPIPCPTTVAKQKTTILKQNGTVTGRIRCSRSRSSSSSGGTSPPPPSESQRQMPEPLVYRGVYGPWTIQPSDIQEVILYRSGLVTAVASFVLASSTLLLPYDSPLNGFIRSNLDLFYTFGACGLGLSLYLIHIYVTEIKRALQALWLLGALGSVAAYASFAQPAGKGLVEYVIESPQAIWFVGPLFAAFTGLVFKEGLCYGKLEAGILTIIIPAVLLGHLTGLMDEGIKVNMVLVWMALSVVFSARKFSQPIKDDIGDKSVFMFNGLREDEKKALLNELEQQMN